MGGGNKDVLSPLIRMGLSVALGFFCTDEPKISLLLSLDDIDVGVGFLDGVGVDVLKGATVGVKLGVGVFVAVGTGVLVGTDVGVGMEVGSTPNIETSVLEDQSVTLVPFAVYRPIFSKYAPFPLKNVLEISGFIFICPDHVPSGLICICKNFLGSMGDDPLYHSFRWLNVYPK